MPPRARRGARGWCGHGTAVPPSSRGPLGRVRRARGARFCRITECVGSSQGKCTPPIILRCGRRPLPMTAWQNTSPARLGFLSRCPRVEVRPDLAQIRPTSVEVVQVWPKLARFGKPMPLVVQIRTWPKFGPMQATPKPNLVNPQWLVNMHFGGAFPHHARFQNQHVLPYILVAGCLVSKTNMFSKNLMCFCQTQPWAS